MGTMRLTRTLWVALLGIPSALHGQGGVPVALDSLRPPPSPAFVLLGISPSAVQRPGLPRAVSTSFLATALADGGFPKNYAVEFAPYWLSSRPGLTIEGYERGDWAANLTRTLAVSFATAERLPDAAGNPLPGTRIGIGGRALPLKGAASDSVPVLLERIRAIQTACLLEDDTEGCLEQRADSLQGLALRTQRAMRDRWGLTLEVAGGVTFDFPRDDFGAREVQRFGVWATPSYRARDSPLEALVVARYLRDSDGAGRDVFDAGGRLVWQWQQLAFSGELVERWSGGSRANSERLSGTVEFQVTGDLYATYTFGRDFAGDDAPGRLISVLGVNFGIGKEPTLMAR